jgi:Flp pilus assembly protein TadG
MIEILSSCLKDRRGAAAAEMAMVTPLLIILLFGPMELGHYFLNQHAVVKAVRDGARFAARLPASNYTCASGSTTGTISSAADGQIKTVTRTGSLDGQAAPRLNYWTSASTIVVTVKCASKTTYPGIYNSISGDVPVVKVKADVPYANGALIGNIGFSSVNLFLRAEAESAVMGI